MPLLPLSSGAAHAQASSQAAPAAPFQVGELGVVSYGGSGGVQPLHALERPFTDHDGVRVMSQVRPATPLPGVAWPPFCPCHDPLTPAPCLLALP